MLDAGHPDRPRVARRRHAGDVGGGGRAPLAGEGWAHEQGRRRAATAWASGGVVVGRVVAGRVVAGGSGGRPGTAGSGRVADPGPEPVQRPEDVGVAPEQSEHEDPEERDDDGVSDDECEQRGSPPMALSDGAVPWRNDVPPSDPTPRLTRGHCAPTDMAVSRTLPGSLHSNGAERWVAGRRGGGATGWRAASALAAARAHATAVR